MKRLGQSDPLDQPDGIDGADFEEIRDAPYTLRSSASRPPPSRHPPAPPSSPPTLRAWWRGKSAGFKALVLTIAAVFIVPVLLTIFGMVSIDHGEEGNPQVAAVDQASAVTFPAGVRPEVVLAIDGGDADPTSTFRTMGAFFCPLLVDGWSIETSVAASKQHTSGETRTLLTYLLTRVDSAPITMVALRLDDGDGDVVEVLRKMRSDGKTTVGQQMWPLVHEILSQDMPQCRAYNGLAR